jgi:hypothetical protein
MAVGHRIMAKPVGSGTVFNTSTKEDMVLVYKLMQDSSGKMIQDTTGGALVERAGGVKAGSTGVIVGPSIKVPRRCLIEYKDVPAAMGVDLVDIYPVQFDHYSGIGFLPGDAIKQIS